MITGGELLRPGEPTGTLTVINGTSGHIDVVTISECAASTYGFDRLPDNVSIGSGQSYSFTVSAGCWDVDAGRSWHRRGTPAPQCRRKWHHRVHSDGLKTLSIRNSFRGEPHGD